MNPPRSSIPPGFFETFVNQTAKRLAQTKICIHPEASACCSGPPIAAHSIQRSGPLGRLLDEKNRVCTFGTAAAILSGQPALVGWREASTFTGFCAKHDDSTFAPIEKQPIIFSPEQCTLIGYRSICFEIFRKYSARALGPLHQRIRQGIFPETTETQIRRLESVRDSGHEKGIIYLADVKHRYEEALRNKAYESFKYVVFRFSGTLSVASVAGVNPDFDLSQKRIQNLARDEAIQGLTYGIVLDGPDFALVFSWLREFDIISEFVKQFAQLDGEALTTALLLFMFAYAENTYFSRSWWNGLRIAQRVRLKNLAHTPIQYGFPVNYRGNSMVDWRLKEVLKAG